MKIFYSVVIILTLGGLLWFFFLNDKALKSLNQIKKRVIELIQFFGIAIVVVFFTHIVLTGLSSIDIFFTLFIYPITGLSWNSEAQISTPIILVVMGISLLIEHTLWRRVIMGLSVLAWVVLGFIILATSIT